jgi:predicted dehydrogenase
MVGFNRRYSPAAREVRKFFGPVASPLTVSIRMNAGAIPADHWTQSEEEGGGRIIGEACHAIDLATYLTGSRPVRVFAESIGGPSAPKITEDQCFITLRHANGSISSIGYLAGGDRSYGKERVEVLGGGRLAVLEDFRELTTAVNVKAKTDKRWQQDKGHRAEIEAFAEALVKGRPSPIPWEEIRSVSLASILAVRSLREGVPFEIP